MKQWLKIAMSSALHAPAQVIYSDPITRMPTPGKRKKHNKKGKHK